MSTLSPLGQVWPKLSPDELDRMQAAAARLYEGRSIGSVERWRSPETRNAGSIKLNRSYESQGMPCRALDYRIRLRQGDNSPDHYTINWCKTAGGDWKIVENRPGR
jgi:surface antigen